MPFNTIQDFLYMGLGFVMGILVGMFYMFLSERNRLREIMKTKGINKLKEDLEI